MEPAHDVSYEVSGSSSELRACTDQFSFSRLTAEKGSMGASPPSAACRYVTPGEMTSIVGRVVRGTKGERSSCRYLVEGDAGEVTVRVDPDGKPGGPPAERVRGLLERAWFSADGADGGELRVSVPGGDVFVVHVALRGVDTDPEEVAVGSYREARPRLRDDGRPVVRSRPEPVRSPSASARRRPPSAGEGCRSRCGSDPGRRTPAGR